MSVRRKRKSESRSYERSSKRRGEERSSRGSKFRGKGRGNKGKKGLYKNIGSVYSGKKRDASPYIGLYDGNMDLLLFDKKTGKVYKPKFLSLFEPKPFGDSEVPKNVEWNIAVNLKADSVEEVDLDELEAEGSDDDEEDESDEDEEDDDEDDEDYDD